MVIGVRIGRLTVVTAFFTVDDIFAKSGRVLDYLYADFWVGWQRATVLHWCISRKLKGAK